MAAPDVPRDAQKPLKGGAWLGYLTAVASAAKHPVPNEAKSLRDRELLAWGGALAGLADRLRAEAALVSDVTDLKRVSEAVVRRLGGCQGRQGLGRTGARVLGRSATCA
ncbi:MAG TPA: hypothetical protein VF395_00700 [Polyangiaceae bacterium]